MKVLTRRRFAAMAAVCGGLVLAGPAAAQMPRFQKFEKAPLQIKTAKGTHRFTVELARTPDQQRQGLMYRRKLAADAGMLFLYPRPEPARFWMKNTFVPLDLLFIDNSGRIVGISERAVPLSLETIASDRPVSAVLEVNAGTAARLGVKTGDRVVCSALGTAAD